MFLPSSSNCRGLHYTLHFDMGVPLLIVARGFVALNPFTLFQKEYRREIQERTLAQEREAHLKDLEAAKAKAEADSAAAEAKAVAAKAEAEASRKSLDEKSKALEMKRRNEAAEKEVQARVKVYKLEQANEKLAKEKAQLEKEKEEEMAELQKQMRLLQDELEEKRKELEWAKRLRTSIEEEEARSAADVDVNDDPDFDLASTEDLASTPDLPSTPDLASTPELLSAAAAAHQHATTSEPLSSDAVERLASTGSGAALDRSLSELGIDEFVVPNDDDDDTILITAAKEAEDYSFAFSQFSQLSDFSEGSQK